MFDFYQFNRFAFQTDVPSASHPLSCYLLSTISLLNSPVAQPALKVFTTFLEHASPARQIVTYDRLTRIVCDVFFFVQPATLIALNVFFRHVHRLYKLTVRNALLHWWLLRMDKDALHCVPLATSISPVFALCAIQLHARYIDFCCQS
jgi:hypothetical protein